MHRCRIVHTVSRLVDRYAQSAPHLLPARNGVVAVLQRADHEHIGIVPALAQRRVREDEAHRLFEFKKLLLVSEDQVIRVHIICFGGFLAGLWIDKVLVFLVDGKITLVRSCGFYAF